MRQLPLEISARPAASFANFLPGANGEAAQAVRALAAGTLPESIVYLWGEQGSGRTHLLSAAARENPGLTIVDDVETLDEAAQQALFMAINEARDRRAAVLAAGSVPPAQLALREDLRTRLAWGLVYQLHRLSDTDKRTHLQAAARERGLQLADEVADFLLARLPRDLASLNEVLEREVLAEGGPGQLVPRQGPGA